MIIEESDEKVLKILLNEYEKQLKEYKIIYSESTGETHKAYTNGKIYATIEAIREINNMLDIIYELKHKRLLKQGF